MIADPLSLGLPSDLLTIDDLLPPAYRERDITDEMLERFFRDVPDDSIDFVHSVVIGRPGSGKTELFRARAKYALDKYGSPNVNLVYTDDLRIAVERMDDRPVQYLIIDDAGSNMSSRNVFDNAKVLGEFNRLRHVYREKGATVGLVLCEFGWQRWKDVDPGFRDGETLIFKTGMTTPSEQAHIEELIGPMYMGRLMDIWEGMSSNPRLKGHSIGRIGPKSIDRGGVGHYRHKRVKDFPEWPEMLRADEWLDAKGNYIEPKDNISAMARMANRGMTQLEIAERLGISQSTVSKGLRKAREEE